MRKALVCSVALASMFLLLVAACTPAQGATYTLGIGTGTTAT